MARQQIEDALSIFLAAARRNRHAEHHFRSLVVRQVAIGEVAEIPRRVDGPPSEAAGRLAHVLLRVAAVDAQRVQLEQLARVVFIQPQLAPVDLLRWLFPFPYGRADRTLRACSPTLSR